MKTYLYLARRNLRGFKLLAILAAKQPCMAIRVPDLKVLRLSIEFEKLISDQVFENRMEWELWLETADSFSELSKKLAKRGYSNLPLRAMPVISSEQNRITSMEEFKKFNKQNKAEVRNNTRPTMAQRKKDG